MGMYQKTITKKQEEDILNLFFRVELRENEKVIDNRDTTISKELNIDVVTVSNCISKHLNKKVQELNKRINKL